MFGLWPNKWLTRDTLLSGMQIPFTLQALNGLVGVKQKPDRCGRKSGFQLWVSCLDAQKCHEYLSGHFVVKDAAVRDSLFMNNCLIFAIIRSFVFINRNIWWNLILNSVLILGPVGDCRPRQTTQKLSLYLQHQSLQLAPHDPVGDFKTPNLLKR